MDLMVAQLHSLVKEAPIDECRNALNKMPMNEACEHLKKKYSADSARKENIAFLKDAFPEMSEEKIGHALDISNNDVDDAFQLLMENPESLEKNKKNDKIPAKTKNPGIKMNQSKPQNSTKSDIKKLANKSFNNQSNNPTNNSINNPTNNNNDNGNKKTENVKKIFGFLPKLPSMIPKVKLFDMNKIKQPIVSSSLSTTNTNKIDNSLEKSKVNSKNAKIEEKVKETIKKPFESTLIKPPTNLPKKPLISSLFRPRNAPDSILLPRMEITPNSIGAPFISANFKPSKIIENSSSDSDIQIIHHVDDESDYDQELNNNNYHHNDNDNYNDGFYDDYNNYDDNNYHDNKSQYNNQNYNNYQNNYNNFDEEEDNNNNYNHYNNDNNGYENYYYNDNDEDIDFGEEDEEEDNGMHIDTNNAQKFERIDLHGYYYKDAKFIVETSIINAKATNVGVFHFVTGVGNNSKNNEPILRPMVMEVCQQLNVYAYISKVNPGIVVVDVNKPFC
ncbi:hypothetical protein TRFO_34893 [Tritrichomonas foetus]|uniref:Smr domain-containing protein n=1 Tax=Tritrichomonas foetus TaxID=1144522 RepID=A0A1J4JMB2_9EUKA|nr:hypothetical protein TRFO_34893 [Tritrichomonas foetus]|eukprot:OHS98669.1 hypothetical protein TRFO_34893 [Tritrichomonas foetus]